jgi:glycogen debranching enzyme
MKRIVFFTALFLISNFFIVGKGLAQSGISWPLPTLLFGRHTEFTEPDGSNAISINNRQNPPVTNAFHIALGDLVSVIRPYPINILDSVANCFMSGGEYLGVWTRDAVEIIYGCGLLIPEIARNTMLAAVTVEEDGSYGIMRAQSWDSPIWTIGAWDYYVYTGDKDFLEIALEASITNLELMERNEYDPEDGLFRGASFFNDGVAGYPEFYARYGDYEPDRHASSFSRIYWMSSIKTWVIANPELRHPKGNGWPMKALSTNCIFYKAYDVIDSMALALDLDVSGFRATEKKEKLKASINEHFWDDDLQRYIYLVDPNGNCDYQEGSGLAMSIIWGVADSARAEKIFRNTHSEPAGLPCIYPSFPRYRDEEGKHYGRHSGTIWPQVNGFWVQAAKKYGKQEIVDFELGNLARFANRDMQFREIYHPVTGLPYGGIQETNPETKWYEWKSMEKQTWCASAYINMVLNSLFGMEFSSNGITFNPMVSEDYQNIALLNLHYRDMVLNVYVKGKGDTIQEFEINGQRSSRPFVSCEGEGVKNVIITLGK